MKILASPTASWEDELALVFRGERFLSIPEAAECLRVTRLTVYRWLRGTRRAPQGIPLHRVIRDTRTQQAYIPRAIVRRLQHALRGARSHTARSKRQRT